MVAEVDIQYIEHLIPDSVQEYAPSASKRLLRVAKSVMPRHSCVVLPYSVFQSSTLICLHYFPTLAFSDMHHPATTHLLSKKSRMKGRDVFIFRFGKGAGPPAVLLAGTFVLGLEVDYDLNQL